MISKEIRQSVQTLHQQGLAIREISRLLSLSRNAIRRILRSPVLAAAREPACPAPVRLWLPAAFARVRGNGVRLQEMLQAELGEHGPRISGLQPGPMRTNLRAKAYQANADLKARPAADYADACVELLSAAGAAWRGTIRDACAR